jgi:hypothetical protein
MGLHCLGEGAQLLTVLAEVNALEGKAALVEVVTAQKDLAPQLKRLAETPAPMRKYGRSV